jgi:hypothetical protein
VEPELTDLFLTAVQGPGHSVFLLHVDLPLELGVPEVAVAARSAATKETPGVMMFV